MNANGHAVRHAPAAKSLYRGQRAAFLTQHGKERIVGPVLEGFVGCQVERAMGYDTDRLGTFTRDIPRAGTQIEAARQKARIGMQLAGLPLGLASEGSFGLDPYAGMFPWNVEFVVFLDDLLGLEVVGMAQGRANSRQVLAASWEDAEGFARAVHFPEHYLVVRPDHEGDPRIGKGIADWPAFRAAYDKAASQSPHGRVFIEVDLRAYANPTRLVTIRLAAVDLGRRLASLCPVCRAPGFWAVESIAGLPCQACGRPTREPRALIDGCLKCGHRVTRACHDPVCADPARCDFCNP
ncbi:DUF6671 family protein [Acidiferrobacter sp.]|uniref:DUF6671 family protein n=1 Tax=Acidiferrobacter sp. TaxID=1872107 RepID=UPI00262DACAE|nr:DUF6671 family protein [Acidiferrobacter sp.]